MVKGRRAVASMRRKGESQSGSPAPSAVEALLDSENLDLYRVEPTLELPPLARRRASHIGRPFEPLLDLAHARPQRARTLVEGIDESALRVGPPRRFGVGRGTRTFESGSHSLAVEAEQILHGVVHRAASMRLRRKPWREDPGARPLISEAGRAPRSVGLRGGGTGLLVREGHHRVDPRRQRAVEEAVAEARQRPFGRGCSSAVRTPRALPLRAHGG